MKLTRLIGPAGLSQQPRMLVLLEANVARGTNDALVAFLAEFLTGPDRVYLYRQLLRRAVSELGCGGSLFACRSHLGLGGLGVPLQGRVLEMTQNHSH